MGAKSTWWRRVWVGCAIVAVCSVATARGLPDSTGLQPPLMVISATAESAGAFAPLMHRFATRFERTADRLLVLIGEVGAFWFWTAVSLGVFLIIAAFSSVVDRRMLTLRHERPGALARYLGYGVRTFFLILIDRHTPYTARLLLGVGLLYWLLPFDLVRDNSLVPGFVDDFFVTVAAAKVFVYLCPTALVAAHAHAVEARARHRAEASSPKPIAARR